ncbi:MICOS complex subunit MIC13 isoform X1 [Chlorocebus sabaeus]|uniref:MICOS complex subunit MIC13 isoform X1 n=1 Tax=Chlorocebus sabaeus TaxID=60711 RepID=UPI00045DEA1B|nr:MICOS complex subunit MIC13 isoform X2 [Chlorocebus sabaeus]
MVARVWSLMRFLIKGSVAGGAVYLVYDQELLGPSDKSQAALQKAGEVVPPAVYQFSQYVCQQTGLQIPQLPAPPKIYFPVRDSWNAGTGRKKGEHRTEFRLRSLRAEGTLERQPGLRRLPVCWTLLPPHFPLVRPTKCGRHPLHSLRYVPSLVRLPGLGQVPDPRCRGSSLLLVRGGLVLSLSLPADAEASPGLVRAPILAQGGRARAQAHRRPEMLLRTFSLHCFHPRLCCENSLSSE